MLRSLVDNRLRLRPVPVRWDRSKYGPADDNWKVVKVSEDRTVELVNERTTQRVSLAPDHIHNYTSNSPGDDSFDGFLELKVKIDITDVNPKIDVILSGAARTVEEPKAPPLRTRVVELLKTINPEIMRAVQSGAAEVRVMISEHNLRLLLELQREDGFSNILSLESTRSVSVGVGSRIGGHLSDLDEGGTRQGYVLRFRA